MKKINFTKVYGCLGKICCGVAGVAVAVVFGGIYWAVPGVIVGVLCGHFLEKSFSTLAVGK